MAKAIWNGVVLAESGETIIVEGNHYFPPDSINMTYFSESAHHSTCYWKGRASYYNIEVNGAVNTNAAWYYPDAKPEADHIANYIAFWHGVRVEA